MTTALTATYVKTVREVDPGDPTRPARQVLLRLEGKSDRPPFYVVASACYIRRGIFDEIGDPETYFFRSDAEGNVTSWAELSGSQVGTLDIPACLSKAGYTLIGWREDAADDYVAAVERICVERICKSTYRPEQGDEVLKMLAALRTRVSEAEATGYRRGILAAREVWRQKEQALRELQSVDHNLRGLLPGGGDR
jgi:hypothetical protein